MKQQFEVVNIKDKTRLSRTAPKGSSTLFDTGKEAMAWLKENGGGTAAGTSNKNGECVWLADYDIQMAK